VARKEGQQILRKSRPSLIKPAEPRLAQDGSDLSWRTLLGHCHRRTLRARVVQMAVIELGCSVSEVIQPLVFLRPYRAGPCPMWGTAGPEQKTRMVGIVDAVGDRDLGSCRSSAIDTPLRISQPAPVAHDTSDNAASRSRTLYTFAGTGFGLEPTTEARNLSSA